MSKLDVFLASTSSRFLVLLLIVIIYTSTTHVNGLVNYHDDNTDEDLKDTFISSKPIDAHYDLESMSADYDHSYKQIHVIPFKKRTIPIELQKALYAHGIVGRR